MTRRVLVVEDHPESAEGLAELLAVWGYEPYVAPDGERALELFADLHPETVVADITLPGIDGYELARRLRRMEHGEETLLVALTGSEAGAAFEAGYDHHMIKPLDLDVLERLLEERRPGAAPSESKPPQGRL